MEEINYENAKQNNYLFSWIFNICLKFSIIE